MTVGELRERMSQAEFIEWSVFLAWEAQQQQLATKRPRRGRQ